MTVEQMDRTDRLSFATDASLGKLAKWMRILGFDTVYVPDASASRFLKLGKERILLTRTKRVRDNNRFYELVFIWSNDPYDQLKEVIQMLRELPLEARRQVPGINENRADIIIAGAAILDVLFEEFKLDEIQVSDRGLRDGLLIDYLARMDKSDPSQ